MGFGIYKERVCYHGSSIAIELFEGLEQEEGRYSLKMKAICAIVVGLIAMVSADVAAPYADVPHGYGLVGHPGFYNGGYGYGYPFGFGVNDEHHYRAHPGYPVHVGNGNFYYLGLYPGQCNNAYSYGFYYANDANSFVVCDHGRPHRFECPYGTKNSDLSKFAYGNRYSMAALCGEHVH